MVLDRDTEHDYFIFSSVEHLRCARFCFSLLVIAVNKADEAPASRGLWWRNYGLHSKWGAKISYFLYEESPDTGMVNKQIYTICGVFRRGGDKLGNPKVSMWGYSEKDIEPHWVIGLKCALNSKFSYMCGDSAVAFGHLRTAGWDPSGESPPHICLTPRAKLQPFSS